MEMYTREEIERSENDLYTGTVDDLLAKAAQHNAKVDYFKNVVLVEKYGEKVNGTQLFKAMQDVREQGFYRVGLRIVRSLKAMGYNCKFDAVNELVVL